MKFCSDCSASLELKFLVDQGRWRHVCCACGGIHYRNPRILVCSAVRWRDRYLVCRRAHEPAAGQWNFPTGFLEINETLQEGAVREILEETGLPIAPEALELYSIFDMVGIQQVGVAFRCELKHRPAIAPGPECTEVAWLSEQEIREVDFAWRERAGNSLDTFFSESRSGTFGIHLHNFDLRPNGRLRSRNYPIVNVTGRIDV